MTSIIGLIGEAGAGKDTVHERTAKLAEKMRLPKVYNMKFATPLHEAVLALSGTDTTNYGEKSLQTMFNLDRVEFYEWLVKLVESKVVDTTMERLRLRVEQTLRRSGANFPSKHHSEFLSTPRKVMEILGTEVFRKHYGEDVWVRALFARVQAIREKDPKAGFMVTDVRFPNEVAAMDAVVGIIREDHPRFYYTEGHASTKLAQSLSIAAWNYEVMRSSFILNDVRTRIRSYGSELARILMTYRDGYSQIRVKEVWNGDAEVSYA